MYCRSSVVLSRSLYVDALARASVTQLKHTHTHTHTQVKHTHEEAGLTERVAGAAKGTDNHTQARHGRAVRVRGEGGGKDAGRYVRVWGGPPMVGS